MRPILYKNQFLLLKEKRFLPIFVTQFLGAFNDNVYKNSLVILITYSLADKLELDAQMLVILAAGVFILPMVLFSAIAVQIADYYEKSRLIKIIKFIEIILMFIACLGFYLENIFVLMITLFLMGMQSTFVGTLKYSILPWNLDQNL